MDEVLILDLILSRVLSKKKKRVRWGIDLDLEKEERTFHEWEILRKGLFTMRSGFHSSLFNHQALQVISLSWKLYFTIST